MGVRERSLVNTSNATAAQPMPHDVVAARWHRPVCTNACLLGPVDDARKKAWMARSYTAAFFPPGLRYLNDQGCDSPPVELGVDYAWLPVSSTHTVRRPVAGGLWMYYMRGCSDFAWQVGRTMLVRNRCHAAVELERRLVFDRSGATRPAPSAINADEDDALWWTAVNRTAAWLSEPYNHRVSLPSLVRRINRRTRSSLLVPPPLECGTPCVRTALSTHPLGCIVSPGCRAHAELHARPSL